MVLSFLIVGCSCRKDDIPRVTYPESYEFQEPDHVFQVPDASSQVSQPANIAIETSVKAGQRVAFHGAVIPAPGEEDPGGVFVFIYDTTPDRERVNAHVEAAEAQNEKFAYRVALQAPAKPGNYEVEIRRAGRPEQQTLLATGTLHVSPDTSHSK